MNDKVQPFSVSRWATMWIFQGYHKVTGKYCVEIFEPLKTNAPRNAKPSISYNKYVDFWNQDGSCYYDQKVTYTELVDVSPILLFIDGKWYERAGGQCIWFEEWECWCMNWSCYSNSRHAHMMNHGMPFYKGEPDTKTELLNKILDQYNSFMEANVKYNAHPGGGASQKIKNKLSVEREAQYNRLSSLITSINK